MGGGGGVLSSVHHKGKLHPKGISISFSGSRFIKGNGFTSWSIEMGWENCSHLGIEKGLSTNRRTKQSSRLSILRGYSREN